MTRRIARAFIGTIGLALLVAANIACGDRPSERDSVSPSGEFRYFYFDADLPDNSHGHVVAIVQRRESGRTGRLLFVAPEYLRDRDNNTVAWGSGDVLWIDSGDTGLWYCQKDKAGKWTLFPYEKGKAPALPKVPGIKPDI